MIKEISLLLNACKRKLDSKAIGILMSPDNLAELIEELELDVFDELVEFLGLKLLVAENEKLAILNEYKGERHYKVSSEGLRFIGEACAARYKKLLEDSEVSISS